MATTKGARQEPTQALVDSEETLTQVSAENGERLAHLQLPEDELRGDEDEAEDDEDPEDDDEDFEEDSEDVEEDEVQVENEQ